MPERCVCHGADRPEGTRDLLEEALASVSLSRCNTMFSVFDWAATPNDVLIDPYRFSFYDQVHNEPLRAPGWANELVGRIEDETTGNESAAFEAARMIEHMALLADRPTITSPAGPLDPIEPLATSVAELIRAMRGTPDEAELRAQATRVPLDLQLAVAEVVDAVRRAAQAREAAIDPTAVELIYDYGPAFVIQRSDGRGLSAATPANRALFNEGIGYGELYGAAVDVLDAIAAADLSRFVGVPTSTIALETAAFLFTADTPIGRIAIGDAESGVYRSTLAEHAGAWALLVDLGGNDDYRIPVAGNVSAANSVSVMIDLAGDDRYGYVEVPHALDGARLPSDGGGRYNPREPPTMDSGPISFSQIPRQGGGRAGTAIHVDLGTGRDRYQSLRLSQGAGAFGTGVLVDEGGDDVYLAEAFAQGSGAFGIGLHYDVSGSDERRAYQFAQGFAYARGVGLSIDQDGADRYLMDVGDPGSGGDPLYFSAQRPGLANSTLGQGFAFGRRADFSDRAFMSGGVGLLIDSRGTDRYEGSIFAQGGGFWFGTGVLADREGDDTYDAMWYGMGTGAHYALGFLLEGAGDDTYGGTFPRVNVTIGGGHDYSAAFLIDEAGNDTYNGSRITIGAGNSNGFGLFVDNGGDDRYSANAAYSIGAAGLVGTDVDFIGSPRHKVHVIGLFIDAAGTDQYERMGMSPMGIGDDQSWTQVVNPSPMVNEIERGAGVDGEGDSTVHTR